MCPKRHTNLSPLSKPGHPSPCSAAPAPRPKSAAPTPVPAAQRSEAASVPHDKRPTPIIQVRDKWPMIPSALSNKFKVVATATAQGIKMQLETADAFRFVTRFLQEKEVYYHTYTLAEERILRVVIKRIPKKIPVEEITQSLKVQKFPVISVFDMTRMGIKAPLDLVQVYLDLTPEGKAIFDVKSI
ncbi:PREDICTED: uncharacterized protein LOC106100008 [Papilio polytes]|uniref:uncharacterized protein LOC106100008 n=1 Tax=Papilio polytes TaxID=76194 RepID=UPI000676B096|nr:PREDICTED: uncharacterized protein LOC106100008 [Papilio polytes]